MWWESESEESVEILSSVRFGYDFEKERRPIMQRKGLKRLVVLSLSLLPLLRAGRAGAGDNATFVSQQMTPLMSTTQTQLVSITMKNTGTTTWTNAAGYKLGTQNPQDNTLWTGATRVLLSPSDAVAPNASKTFVFTITAPSTAGPRDFQWQMVRDPNLGWFGALTQDISVQVGGAPCVMISSPVINAPSSAAAGATGLIASVTNNLGSTWAWTLTNGTITSGQGTSQVVFTAGNAGLTMVLGVTETSASGCLSTAVTAKIQVDFTDVPSSNGFHNVVDTAAKYGVMTGCVPGNSCATGCTLGNFCASTSVTRAQMAGYLLRSEHGGMYVPPPATGLFADVPISSVDAPWIEELYNEGITGGCGTNPLVYCPSNPVTRAQMAVFILVTKYGPSYAPPACAGIFADMPCDPQHPFTPWAEELYNEGITGGCPPNPPLNFCPNDSTLQTQMAAFLVAAFNLADPVALWYLDDNLPAASTVNDYSGFGNTGSVSGTAIVPGVAGYARQFANTNDWIYSNTLTPTINIGGAITLEAWINPLDRVNTVIVNKTPQSTLSPDNFDMLMDSSGHLQFVHDSNQGLKTYTSTGIVPLNTWSHVAVSWGSGNVKFFINGAVDSSRSDSGETATTTGTYVRIGRRTDGRYFNGTIDEVKIWNYARTPSQLASTYTPQPNCGNANPNDTLADDAALQACLDRGGEIRLVPGSPGYILSTGVQLSRDGTVITSTTTGTRALLIAASTLSGAPLLRIANRNNFAISFLTFDGNRDNRDYTHRCVGSHPIESTLQAFSPNSHFAFTDNEVTRTLCGSGFEVAGTAYDFGRNVILDNGQGREINPAPGLTPWSDGITVWNCGCDDPSTYSGCSSIHDNNITDATDVGMAVSPSPGCRIINNSFSNVARHVLAAQGTPNGDFSNALISGNSISAASNMLSIGIAVGSHEWFPDHYTLGGTISNNTITGAVVNMIVDGANGVVVTGNVFGTAQGTPRCGGSATNYVVAPNPHVVSSQVQTGYVSRIYDGCLP
jgi:hypothetical protein